VKAVAVKFLWQRKHFEERSWKQKQTRKHLTFEEPEAEAIFIKHVTGMWKQSWKRLNFCGNRSTLKRGWKRKQTRKRLTLYGAGSEKYSTACFLPHL